MRKIVLLISMFLLPATWAFGQYGERPYDRDQGGHRMRVEGCLFGEPGNLALIDDQGNTYNLAGRTARLNSFIGHRVRVEGNTWFDANNPYAMSEGGDQIPTLRVFETEQVYRGRCDQWGGNDNEFRFRIPIR